MVVIGGTPSFAGWLPYNDPSDRNQSRAGNVGTVTGGYRVTIENMDPNSHIVQFQPPPSIDRRRRRQDLSKDFRHRRWNGRSDDSLLTGSRQPTLTPDPYTFPLTLDSALGSFVIERPVSSTADDVAIAKTGFEITITQSLPWAATTTLEGTFEGEVDSAGTTVKVTFDKA